MICYKNWEIDSFNKYLLNSGNVPGIVHHANKGQIDYIVVTKYLQTSLIYSPHSFLVLSWPGVTLLHHQHHLGGPANRGASVLYNEGLMIERNGEACTES